MENNRHQQQSSEASVAQSARLRSAQALPSQQRKMSLSGGLGSLFALLKRAPWLIWLTLWLLLVTTSIVAIFNLTYTGFVAQKDLQPKPASTLPAVKTPTTTQPTPLKTPVRIPSRTSTSLALLIIGAAVVCTLGYLVVFKILLTPSADKTRQRVRESTQGRRNRQQQRLLKAEPQIVVTPVPEESAKPEPEIASSNKTDAAVVTVLPPEESEPLDTEVSLVEMMDIRKHRSLSSILGENVDQESEPK